MVEALSDPDTITLPPHITMQQAKNFMKTVVKGDPNEGGIIKQAVKGVVQSLVPHG